MIPFWLDNYKILYSDKNYISFFPSKNMTKNEQLNSLTRFGIYLCILLILFSDNINWLFCPILIIVICVALSNADTFESFYNKQNEILIINKQVNENQNNKNNKNNKNNVNGLIKSHKNKCTMPTTNNPFMNILTSDYINDPKRPPACDPFKKSVEKEIENKFNDNLNQNPQYFKGGEEDMYDKTGSSQLAYYTMPSTQIPNNQNAFAEWLYNSNKNCKTDPKYCLKYANIKYNKK